MWIPFTLLRVAAIQEALAAGFSFINRWVPNEIVSVPWLSNALSKRFFLPMVKNIRANFLRRTRKVYQGRQPQPGLLRYGRRRFLSSQVRPESALPRFWHRPRGDAHASLSRCDPAPSQEE